MTDFSFGKSEKLKSEKIISKLFKTGKSVAKYPIRLVWMPIEITDGRSLFQLSFSVPKKKFKKSVDRNRIKRQMKEAYRLNKSYLYKYFQQLDNHYAMMIIYTSNEPIEYQFIFQNMQKAMRSMVKECGKVA